MATATLRTQSVPDPTHQSLPIRPPEDASSAILEEVRAAHRTLRTRLAGAITRPPPDIDRSALPTVPVIDLSPSFTDDRSARASVASQIRLACLTTGFFQISNHGVTSAAQAGILEQARRYIHGLTPAQKDSMHIRHSKYFRGYEPGDASYTGDDMIAESTIGAQPETKEAFNWGYEPSLDPSGDDGAYVELDGSTPPPGHGFNVWPSENDLPGFHEGVAEYYAQIMHLARHLFRLFALGLGLEETYFDNLTTHPGGIGRLLYYPPQPAKDDHDDEGGTLGLGAHTDYECFTLLLSSSNSGLEILFPPSEQTGGKAMWRPCPVRPGTLVRSHLLLDYVLIPCSDSRLTPDPHKLDTDPCTSQTVNVADFLQRWTYGQYKSTVHRVVTRPGVGERYSVPLFYSINYDADVEPLPIKLDAKDATDRTDYKPMKAGQYVLERLRATRTIEQEEERKGMWAQETG